MNLKNKLFLLSASLMMLTNPGFAGEVTIQNITNANDAAYGVFNSGGTLYSTTGDATIRLGVSSLSNSEIISNYTSGNLAAIDSNFTDFGSSFGFSLADGVFQNLNQESTTSFIGQSMILWISSDSSFTSASNEYFIYKFDITFGDDDPLFSANALLGTTPGTLLVGEYGNYSHDYGFGGGSLQGFNTVSVVPEPHVAALAMGFLASLLFIFRKRFSSGKQ